MIKKVAAFTSTGSWTVPAGVTYAIAHMRGGGGGAGQLATAGAGGDSSVAFASGTVTAPGGNGGVSEYIGTNYTARTFAGKPNSGHAAKYIRGTQNMMVEATDDGAYIVAGADVTPAASITVTVGAGGTAGTQGSAGGSGYVWIEYYEEA
jgi:hypothetical protein